MINPEIAAYRIPLADQVIWGLKGGQASPRTPVESPDSLVSTQQARLIDLISEGEIVGLVNGANSIFLDEAPAPSYPSFQWDARVGTQDQPYIKGFPSVESDISVGIELQAATPYVRSVTNLTVSALRINFSLSRLAYQDTETGDTVGYRVDYAIDVAVGFGEYEQVLSSAFDGKTTGGYTRSVRIDLPGNPTNGWRVRIRRLTPNATTSNIADAVIVSSVTEVVDYKFRYPNSALVAMTFDAETFSGKVPKRSFHIKGRIVRVPVNYDPETRTYAGVWDGTFKLAWTDCPPWIYQDLLLNERFGLGDRINANQIDKWGLYQIAQYCDQMVDDGKGGLEPRFTCNLYLQTKADALKVLQDIAAIFRGITYWGLGQAIVSADMPGDPVYNYTNANVIDGKFSRKGSKRSTRYSVVLSSWNDKTDFCRAKVEYVQDDAMVARYGVKSISLTNIGCNSQGQAQRAARWALLSNRYDTDVVNFSVGLEGIMALPGQIIRVSDQHRQGRRVGGRVRHGSTASVVIVDMLPSSSLEIGDELSLNTPDGGSETRLVAHIDDSKNEVHLEEPLSFVPSRGVVWVYESASLKSELYRLVSISEGSTPLDYNLSAVTYTPGKHENIDYGTIISSRPVTVIPTSVIPAPQNVRATTDWRLDQYAAVTTMTIAWDAVTEAARYDVEWKRDNLDWVFAGRVAPTEVQVIGVYSGSYRIRVRSVGANNVLSAWSEIGPLPLLGKTDPPPIPVNVRTVSEVFAIRLRWDFPAKAEDTAFTQIQMATSPSGANLVEQGQVSYPTSMYLHSGMGAAVVRYFRVRLIDKTGNVGSWSEWVYGQSSADATEILDYITGQITETQLGQNLLSEIQKISGVGPGSVNERLGFVSLDLGNRITVGDQALQIQIDGISSQISDIIGADDWSPSQAYLAGSLVKFDGKLYRALTDVPAGTPVTNTVYWEKIGDYSSLGEMVMALAVRVDGVETSVTEINGELAAMASRIIGVEVAINPRMAGATNWYAGATEVRAGAWSIYAAFGSADLAIAQRIDTVQASINDTSARITEESYVRATADTALAQNILTVETKVGANTSAITEERTARTSADQALTLRIDSANSRIGDAEAAITTEAGTRAQADSALTLRIDTANSRIANAEAAIATETQTRAEVDEALSTIINQVSARVANNEAAIITETQTRANEDAALSTVINQVSARVGTNEANIQTVSSAQATTDGKLNVMYSVKLGVDLNGRYYGAGMGIGIENTPSGMQSQVVFLADRFAVMNMVNGYPTSIFALEGGQAFLNSAVIKQADILNLIITGELRSPNYVPGSQGIRINFVTNEFEINGVVPGSGRLNMTNTLIRIWDNTTLRVRLGLWS